MFTTQQPSQVLPLGRCSSIPHKPVCRFLFHVGHVLSHDVPFPAAAQATCVVEQGPTVGSLQVRCSILAYSHESGDANQHDVAFPTFCHVLCMPSLGHHPHRSLIRVGLLVAGNCDCIQA